MGTEKSELLVNNRFACVSVSRAQHDAHIYTNDGASFPEVSVAKVRSVQLPKWNSSRLRRRPNQLASREHPSDEEQGHCLGIDGIA